MKFKRSVVAEWVVTIMLFLSIAPVFYYGTIWEERAHPVAGAVVHLHDGSSLTGELSRAWDGSHTLTQGDGTVRRFEEADYSSMTISEPSTKRIPWRFATPLLLIAFLMGSASFWVAGVDRWLSGMIGRVCKK